MRIRHWSLCLVLILCLGPAGLGAQSLNVRLDGDELRLLVPGVRFLRDETLQQLQNGASVNYVFHASIATDRDGATIAEATFRFVISYDLWEEKYAVRRLEPLPRSVSNLSAAAVEAWCLDSLTLSLNRLVETQPFWVSLNYRVEEPAVTAKGPDNSGSTLARLIDIFSRRGQRQDLGGSRQGGPFRLADLRRSRGR